MQLIKIIENLTNTLMKKNLAYNLFKRYLSYISVNKSSKIINKV